MIIITKMVSFMPKIVCVSVTEKRINREYDDLGKIV